MPVSPQDFALWSDLTGNPYPQTPAERMAIAPEVYNFTRNIGRRGTQPMGGFRKAVDVIGKAALTAGALAGAAYLLKGDDNTPPPPPSPTTGSVVAAPFSASAEPIQEVTVRVEKPSANISSKEFLSGFTPKGLLTPSLVLDDEPGVPPYQTQSANPLGRTAAASADITPPTTSDRYGQDVVPHQTQTMQEMRGVSPAKPTVVDSEEKPATQSHVITSSQTFSPGSEVEQLSKSGVPHTPVRDRADELISEFLGNVAAEQRQQARVEKSVAEYAAGVTGRGERALKDVLKEGRQEGISPVGRGAVRAAESFRQTPQYTEMMRSAGASMEPEELIGGSAQPVSFTKVRPTAETRLTGAEPAAIESPITAMVSPKVEAPASVVSAPAAPVASAPARRTAESEEAEAFARKALGLMPKSQGTALLKAKQPEAIVTSQPESVRVSEDIGDTTAKLLRQAKAMRTSREEAGGMISQDIPTGPIHNISVSPANEVAVTYKTKAGSQTYNFDADPKYVNELVDRIQRGTFVKGQDSAGGFINAGRSMGLLQ
jgi:hypothetical protein